MTELFTKSVEFKKNLKFALERVLHDERIRIQAYHFDDEDLVYAFEQCRAWRIEVLVDERSYQEVERTKQNVKRFLDKGADIRLIRGYDMSLMYGNRVQYRGCHHTKAVCISAAYYTLLWVGSCNLTRASEYNHDHDEVGREPPA